MPTPSRSRRRRVLPGALVAVLLAGAAPGAEAAGLDEARFTATFDATMRTTWTWPRHEYPGNCSGRPWRSGSGSETWRIRTRGVQKVLALRTGPRLVTWMGGWTVGGAADPIAAGGLISRDAIVASGTTQGWCGGGTVDPPPQTDCGDRLPSYDLHVTQLGRSLAVVPRLTSAPVNQRIGYATCRLPMADGITQGSWPTDVPGRLEHAAVFGRRKTLTVRGGRTWTQPHHGDSGYGNLSTTTTLTWTMRLTRKR